jgi:5,10-methylene-tetrahydrofolate dehydrogenase/methenyl tetrahydrofolate cyclohydrolase
MPEAKILDGKYWAAQIKAEVRAGVQALTAAGKPCRLTVLLAGDDPASAVYVRGKEKDCAVRAAVEAGKIPSSRYENYLRMYEEIGPLRPWELQK